ncbi:MAG: YihA family ribosome biogenesis GTP-binding protein [Hyphomicrobiales bacterium]|nr:YihA family ribosome biogenesis GTP-binding protein [Hyphomicrobiales bacterium]
MPPDSPDTAAETAARLEAGRLFFARPWRFVMSVASPDGLPPPAEVEIAFAGRSNVGKSSLINALTGRKALARTSNTPGRTRELNLFTADAGITIVDMPGYGYARASKRDIAGWTRLSFDYLRGRADLRRVYLLVDSRHGLKPSDSEALDLFDKAAVSYQIVLTKCDQPKAAALAEIVDGTTAAILRRPAAYPGVLLTSAKSGAGIAELRAEIAALA